MSLDWIVTNEGKSLNYEELDTSESRGFSETPKQTYRVAHFQSSFDEGTDEGIPKSFVKITGNEVRLSLKVPKKELIPDYLDIIKTDFPSKKSSYTPHSREFMRSSLYYKDTSNSHILFDYGLSILYPRDKSYMELSFQPFCFEKGDQYVQKLYDIVKKIAPKYYTDHLF